MAIKTLFAIMTIARRDQIDLGTTPYYHCMSRCVRQAFLCGLDRFSGRSFNHRKVWILDRIKLLTSIFAIDLCAYAIMSNHYHLVLHVNVQQAHTWEREEVIKRWQRLFGNRVAAAGNKTCHDISNEQVELWRSRLANVSWFMRCLNENIARRANGEDLCKGRFWEGRFKCRALLDDIGLLTCMTYVDLNPVRAGVASTPESSDFTSIQERICHYQKSKNKSSGAQAADQPATLMNFTSLIKTNNPDQLSLPLELENYLTVVDWASRGILLHKKGYVPNDFPPILERLNINPEQWLLTLKKYDKQFFRYVGGWQAICAVGEKLKKRWLKGIVPARQLMIGH